MLYAVYLCPDAQEKILMIRVSALLCICLFAVLSHFKQMEDKNDGCWLLEDNKNIYFSLKETTATIMIM